MRVALWVLLVGLMSTGLAGAASPLNDVPAGFPVEPHICVPLTNICPNHPDLGPYITFILDLL